MSEKQNKYLNGGLYLAGITGLVGVGITVVSIPFILPAFRRICLPFLPATRRQVEFVLKHLNGRQGKLVDLGSGDGRIVIEAAKKHGIQAEGIELNPWLVLYSRIKAMTEGVTATTKFKCQDLWKANLKPYNNVIIFGVDSMNCLTFSTADGSILSILKRDSRNSFVNKMAQLEEKLTAELNNGTWVIACRFPLPSWKPIAITDAGIDSVWVYESGISEKQ